jgi:hypothetical protein
MPTYNLWNSLEREVAWLRKHIPVEPEVGDGEAGTGTFDVRELTSQEQDQLGQILYDLMQGDPEILEGAVQRLNYRLAARSVDLLILPPVRRAR